AADLESTAVSLTRRIGRPRMLASRPEIYCRRRWCGGINEPGYPDRSPFARDPADESLPHVVAGVLLGVFRVVRHRATDARRAGGSRADAGTDRKYDHR